MQPSTKQDQQISPSNTTVTIPELGLEIVHLPPCPNTVEGIHKIKVINNGTEDFTRTVSLDLNDNLRFDEARLTLNELNFSVAAGETQEKEVELKIKRYHATRSPCGSVTLNFGFGDHVKSIEMRVN